MRVILTENVASLGEIGELVNVARGYARNFLLPQKLALEATGKNVRELEHKQRMLGEKREKVRQQMLSLAEKLNRVRIVAKRKVAEDQKLYGSVSATDIMSALAEQGFDVARKAVQLDQPVKQLGEHTIPVRVDAQIVANVTLVVEKEE
jgi:large subunit ribosomal protein L9